MRVHVIIETIRKLKDTTNNNNKRNDTTIRLLPVTSKFNGIKL